MQTMPTATTQDPTRKPDLAKIHIAKTQLQLTDDDYRALLQTLFQQPSSSALTPAQRTHLLTHFKKLGFNPQSNPKSGPTKRPAFTPSDNPQHRLIYAQWAELGRLGALTTPGTKTLHAFVKAQYQVDNLRFLGTANSRLLIEALKAWLARSKSAKAHRANP